MIMNVFPNTCIYKMWWVIFLSPCYVSPGLPPSSFHFPQTIWEVHWLSSSNVLSPSFLGAPGMGDYYIIAVFPPKNNYIHVCIHDYEWYSRVQPSVWFGCWPRQTRLKSTAISRYYNILNTKISFNYISSLKDRCSFFFPQNGQNQEQNSY